ncbi:MAG: DNA-directed RNA polymerase subunit P [Candidatus Nezhaarchaeales archaeon]
MSYKCGKCKRVFSKEELESMPGIRCPFCNGRILYKVRPNVVIKIKAR